MTKRSRKTSAEKRGIAKSGQKSQSSIQELVIVASADTMDEAKDYAALLGSNNISAVIKKHQDELTGVRRLVVMVTEEAADEAHVIIESQDSFDDFYDSELDDDISEEDLEGDVFED